MCLESSLIIWFKTYFGDSLHTGQKTSWAEHFNKVNSHYIQMHSKNIQIHTFQSQSWTEYFLHTLTKLLYCSSVQHHYGCSHNQTFEQYLFWTFYSLSDFAWFCHLDYQWTNTNTHQQDYRGTIRESKRKSFSNATYWTVNRKKHRFNNKSASQYQTPR